MQVLSTPPGSWEGWEFLLRNLLGPAAADQHLRSWVSMATGPSTSEHSLHRTWARPTQGWPRPPCSLANLSQQRLSALGPLRP